METFINRATTLVKTASKLAKLQGSRQESRFLSKAKARLMETGYDNLNNGTTFFSLLLEVPIEIFSKIQNEQEQLEKSILERMAVLTRTDIGNSISEVIISPILLDEVLELEHPGEAKTEMVPSFWTAGYFRLFISHSTAIKDKAHKLKEELASFQIATFVAHDDIEASLEWQTEIESALRTMDALVAIISPEFTSSAWCDQEVGFALGKGKFVLPIMLGATPYGFIGKIQGLKSSDYKKTSDIAQKIIEILLQNELSSPRMTEVLVEKLVKSGGWDSSRATLSLLEKTIELTPAQIGRLLRAIEENIDVRQAFTVPDRINKLIERLS